MESEVEAFVINLENNNKKFEETSEKVLNAFMKIQEVCVQKSSFFDHSFNFVFKKFYQKNNFQIEEADYYKDNYKNRLEITLKRKLFFKKRKKERIKKTIQNINIPPKSKIYITLSQNIRIEEIKNIWQIIGPSSLDNVYSQKTLKLLENPDTCNSKQFPLDRILKISYLIREIQKNFGISSQYMKMAAVIFQKKESSFDYFWRKILKDSNQKNGKETLIKKIYPKKYSHYFCSICNVYGCFHFVNNSSSQSTDTNYESPFYFPKNIKKSFKIKWFLLYRCKDKKDCFRNFKKKDCYNIKGNEHTIFKKFEKKVIEFCQDFEMLNSCFIYLILKNGGSNKNCNEIRNYLDYMNEQKKIEIYKCSNIHRIRFLNNHSNIYKKKINEQLVEYIPCFHEGI